MPRPEPQITEIAGVLAATLPTEGVSTEASVEAWRSSLRYARNNGAIGPITDMLRRDAGHDEAVAKACDELNG